MDMKAITKSTRAAEDIVARLEDGEGTDDERKGMWKLGVRAIERAKLLLDDATVRADDQMLVRECVREHVDGLEKRLVKVDV